MCERTTEMTLGSLEPEVQEKDTTTWTRVYARLPQGEYPVTHAHIDALAAVDPKAVYDAAVEAVLSAAARSSGNA
ncbi:hypothetical protein ACIQCF_23205 [Streptomyces sp. NPDC088353]|uniref:hypothetical protein n=1 Tax=Streptomyces sp. NPDC088353 TaxID=3365855 RepID=UPI00380FA41A